MVLLFVLTLAGLYLGLGTVFAVAFVIRGVQAIDADARDAGLGFRLIILPGCILLWPVLFKKWIRVHKTASHDRRSA